MCRSRNNKGEVVDPEIEIVGFREIAKFRREVRRMRSGFWKQVVESVPVLPPGTAVKVRIEDTYYDHSAATTSVKFWERKLGSPPLTLVHGENCVFVYRASRAGRKRQKYEKRNTSRERSSILHEVDNRDSTGHVGRVSDRLDRAVR